MRPTVFATLGWLLVSAAASGAQPAPRYLQLVNHAFDSVVTVQAAPHGQPGFQAVLLDGPLRGGGDGQTVTLAGGTCEYDLRFGFSDGRALRYEGVDLCRYGLLRIRPLPRGTGAAGDYVVSWSSPADGAAPLADRAAPPSH